jgi:hypothetical protein
MNNLINIDSSISKGGTAHCILSQEEEMNVYSDAW